MSTERTMATDRTGTTRSVSKFDKRLRTILQKRGRLGSDVLGETAVAAEERGTSLSEALVAEKLIEEEELLAILAEETRIPPIHVRKVKPDDSLFDILPENLAQYYGVVPISKVGNLLTLAVSNPFDILKLDDIQIVTGCEIRPVLAIDFTLEAAIPEIYNRGQQIVQDLMQGLDEPEIEFKPDASNDEEITLEDIRSENEQAPVVKLVNVVIFQAIRDHASDIHIEPLEKQIRVRYRIDGVMRETLSPPKKMHNAIVSRIKIMSGLDIAEKRIPQDGKFQLKVEGRQIDFRVSILPLIHGEKVVLRILDSSNLALSLDSLGFEEKALADLRRAIHLPWGMLLVTGPTGSGKSTTLYSSIREVLSVEDNIVTVEDPVEYQLEGVNQVPVNPKRGLTFAVALRSILRQDPDTVMIGEVRDLETAEIAVKAALTGHLVLSTLHTNDAPSTITRLIDMGVDSFLVASAVNCVVAQRLGRRLCTGCRKALDPPPPPEKLLSTGFRPEDIEGLTLHEPQGCPRCERGYKGRFALLETMPMTEDVRRSVVAGGTAIEIKDIALKQGMITLRRCGLLNAGRGKTSIEEVLRVTIED
ncbi:MAG: Flp pilus assembly complex ATPase component TadA [Planctomycetes bacterium]|nr:Flp pilus assembly complex ATPase component TadA [Planctomycetota bacterium]